MSQERAKGKEANSNRPFQIAPLGVFLLLLLVGGFLWWRWNHRTDPKQQVQRFLTAVKAQDWKAIYPVTEVDTTQYPNAMTYEAKMNAVLKKSPAEQEVRKLLKSVDFRLGEPRYENAEAFVPVTISAQIFGQSQTEEITIKLRNFQGIWKVASDNKGVGGLGSFGGLGTSP